MKAQKSGIDIIHRFLRPSRADNSGVSSGNWPKYELIQAFMHVLITCTVTYNSRAGGRGFDTYQRRVVSLSKDTFTPRKVLVIPRKRWLRPDITEKLFTGSLSHSKPFPPSMIVQALMHVLITCKYGYDFIKNSRENVMTSFPPF